MALEVEYFGITGTIKTDKALTLSFTPVDPNEVSVDPITGPAQIINQDFGVTGAIVSWDITGSDIKSVSEDPADHTLKLRIIYER